MDPCVLCLAAHADPLTRLPQHLVNPGDGTPMLFDIRSQAMCPTCGAIWWRSRNVAVLIDPPPQRKPPKRVTVARPARQSR